MFRRNRPEARDASLAALLKVLERSGMTFSGIPVDADKALTNSSVWACIELVAGVGSSLPLDEYKKVNGKLVAVPLSPLFDDPDPDPSVTAVGCRAQLLRSAVTRGNAYADLIDASGGVATGMVSIHPDRVAWRYEKTDGVSRWETYVDGKRRDRWPYGDLWHFPLFQQPGNPQGLNPVEYHRQAIGAALAAQKFGAQYFDAGGHPVLVATTEQDNGEDWATKAKQKLIEATRGNRDPVVVSGMKLDSLTIPAEEAQFLETQRFGVEDIARVFLGGFPEMIGGSVSGEGVVYANNEQRMAAFIALSLSPRYLIPFESALSALLPAGRIVKHNVNALLRADLKARYDSYKVAAEVADLMGTPLLDIDEMRGFEDLPPTGGKFTRKPTKAQQREQLKGGPADA